MLCVEQTSVETYQLVTAAGYMLLSGRVRRPEERQVIREVIARHLKRNVDEEALFSLTDKTSETTRDILQVKLTLRFPEANKFVHDVRKEKR